MSSIFVRSLLLFRRGRRPKVPKPPEIHGGSIFEKDPNILAAEFDGGQTLLFNSESRTSILLNETASRVYEATNGDLDVSGISRAIGKIYGEDPGVIFEDIAEIYRQFFEKGVVTDGR